MRISHTFFFAQGNVMLQLKYMQSIKTEDTGLEGGAQQVSCFDPRMKQEDQGTSTLLSLHIIHSWAHSQQVQ